jgi:hypothetical protein
MNSLDSKKEPELANTEIKNRTAKRVEICYLVEQFLACRDQLVTDYTRQFKVYECITLCQKFVYCQFCYCWQTSGLHSKFVASFLPHIPVILKKVRYSPEAYLNIKFETLCEMSLILVLPQVFIPPPFINSEY